MIIILLKNARDTDEDSKFVGSCSLFYEALKDAGGVIYDRRALPRRLDGGSIKSQLTTSRKQIRA